MRGLRLTAGMSPGLDDTTRSELIAWLESKRRHVVQQVEEMPASERRTSRLPSGWTPLGLVHHLTMDVERVWFRAVMAGQAVEIPGGYAGWRAPPRTRATST